VAKKSTPTSDDCVAMIEIPRAARIYVDTNLWIYHVQAVPIWVDRVGSFLDAAALAEATLLTSQFSWAECIAKPARDNDRLAMSAFDDFFQAGDIELLPVDGDLAIRASRQGGSIGLKLADAIHFISALHHNCTHFATSDRRFRSGAELEMLLISHQDGPREQ
jgi:predicted nucleic acid-binding protein